VLSPNRKISAIGHFVNDRVRPRSKKGEIIENRIGQAIICAPYGHSATDFLADIPNRDYHGHSATDFDRPEGLIMAVESNHGGLELGQSVIYTVRN
jgi:hypothetical protein